MEAVPTGQDEEDFDDQGQKQPIELYEGQILDGRNRYAVCLDLGIEPKFTEYTGAEPIAHIVALNIARRHLSTSQLTYLAVKMLPPLQEEARKRQVANLKRGDEKPVPANSPERGLLPTDQYEENFDDLGEASACPQTLPAGIAETGEAREKAAEIVGIGSNSVQRGLAIQSADPELFERMGKNEVSVNAAYKRIKASNKELWGLIDHMLKREWEPAAATVSARLACICPRTSLRSGRTSIASATPRTSTAVRGAKRVVSSR